MSNQAIQESLRLTAINLFDAGAWAGIPFKACFTLDLDVVKELLRMGAEDRLCALVLLVKRQAEYRKALQQLERSKSPVKTILAWRLRSLQFFTKALPLRLP